MGKILDMCDKSYKKRQLNEARNFQNIRRGLKKYMFNVDKTLDEIEDWEELISLKEEPTENKKLMKTKTIKEEYKAPKKKNYYEYMGLIFCIFHLVGVQTSIIVLNSLFSEIVDEFELLINKTPREYSFYEYLEINSYKILPEIDVAMITSSVGIICLRSCGFYCSIITFQLISMVLFLLLFLFFDFHTGDELLNNYSQLDFTIIILSYIFLSITVGCFSTIALKEYFDMFSGVFSKDENKEDDEKPLFYILSGLSLLIVMGVNRRIFISVKIENSKLITISIIIVCFISLILSFIFHYIFLIPVREKTKDEILKENTNKENQYKTYDIKKEQIKSNNWEDQINDINDLEENAEKDSDRNKVNNKTEEAKSKGEIIIKSKKSFRNNENQINEIDIKDILPTDTKKKKEIHSTKICTLCGYLYFQKDIENKSACICYYYTGKCNWFKEKIFRFDVIAPVLTELYCQLCIIGYNSLLSEKLVKVYTFSKNIKFYLALILLSIGLGCITTPDLLKNQKEKNEKEKGKKKRLFDCINIPIIWLIFYYVLGLTFLTFISSICYMTDKNLSRGRWDNIIMAEFILFKIIDMSILGFFDFFDNSDIFNTSLAITLEKFIWMIIETIIEVSKPSIKSLVIVQIIVTSTIFGLSIFMIFYFCCCELK